MTRYAAAAAALVLLCLTANTAGGGNHARPTRLKASVTKTSAHKADQLVVYSASWCPPCQRLKPVLQALQQEGYRVVSRDVEKESDQLKYDYQRLPTIYFLAGEEVVKQETGFRDKEQIKESLAPLTGKLPLFVSWK